MPPLQEVGQSLFKDTKKEKIFHTSSNLFQQLITHTVKSVCFISYLNIVKFLLQDIIFSMLFPSRLNSPLVACIFFL